MCIRDSSIGGLLLLFLAVQKSNVIFFVAAGTYFLLAIFTLILLPKNCNGEKCPRVPLDSYKLILKNKPFLLFGILVVLFNGIFSLIQLLLPLRANAVLINETLAGSIFTIMSVSVIIFQGVISKYILRRFNPLTSIFFAMIFFSAGLFLMGTAYTFLFLAFSAVVFTVGQMLMLPTTDSVISKLADAKLIGAYFSIANLLHGLGSAGGAFLAGRLIAVHGIEKSMTPWVIFSITSLIIGGLILIARNIPAIKRSI